LAFGLLAICWSCGGAADARDISPATDPALASKSCGLPYTTQQTINPAQIDLVIRTVNVLHSRQNDVIFGRDGKPNVCPARVARGAAYPLRLKGIAQEFHNDWPHHVGIIAVQEAEDVGRDHRHDEKCLAAPSGEKHVRCFRQLLKAKFSGDTIQARQEGQLGVIAGMPWEIVDHTWLQDGRHGFLETILRHSTRGWVFRFYSIHLKAYDENFAFRQLQLSHPPGGTIGAGEGGIIEQIRARVKPGELPPVAAGDFNFHRETEPKTYGLLNEHFYLTHDLASGCINSDPMNELPEAGKSTNDQIWIGRRSSFPVDSFEVLRFHSNTTYAGGIRLKPHPDASEDNPNTWTYNVDGKPLYQLSDHDSPGFSLKVAEPMYRISVTTGDRDHAETDAKVFITLIGSQQSSNEIMLNELGRAPFRRGQTDRFSAYTPTPATGDIGKIRIRHDNSGGDDAGWFLHTVSIRDTKAGKTYRFDCNFWLADNIGEKLIDRTCDVKETLTNYAVTVHTEDKEHADTDANVFVIFHGTIRTPEQQHLSDPFRNPSPFERGNRDFFRLPLRELGELTALTVWHDNSGGNNAGWMLFDITVRNEATGKTWVFPCHNWLATNTGLRRTGARLDAARCRRIEP
jgi:endonuclease/exonuclease/phosphatase family metal-dependent hydrolase